MEEIRVRLVFEDHHILSKSQIQKGLKNSWILLKPSHYKTISDLSAYLLRVFHLQHSCPDGITLSMDGFVLPPFESTCILMDKDIVCVRKEGDASTELGNGVSTSGDVHPAIGDVKLLTNEEFEKETGGYESAEEDQHEMPFDALELEDTPADTIKASPVFPRDVENDVHVVNSGSCQLQENGQADVDVISTPGVTKKCPSRSALRKQVKRRWKREQAEIAKRPHWKQSLTEDYQQSPNNADKKHSDDHQKEDPKPRDKENKKSYEDQQPDPSSDADDNGDNVDNEKAHAPTQENGKVNPWEEISQALSAKKAQLSQVDVQSTKESSGSALRRHMTLNVGKSTMQAKECRIIIDSDEEFDGVFSCLINEKETDRENKRIEDAKEEAERILRKARKRKRKSCGHINID